MIYRKKKDIIDFFDVSIIMPFYKRLNDFKRVLPKNAFFFQRNGIEVVIMLDHSEEEKDLLKLIIEYPFINFKILINRKDHEWRNPCKVLNVGIRHATYKYILVLDPEVELITDVIYQLRYTLEYYPLSYATGMVTFISHSKNIMDLKNPNWMSYGSIMVDKEDIIQVYGYDEYHSIWGGEDDQIRRKLDLFGLKKIEIFDAKTVHREEESDNHTQRSKRIENMPVRHLKNILYPKSLSKNNKFWGRDFKELLWHWEINKNYDQLKKFLTCFEDHEVMGKKKFQQKFEIIALIQTRNESSNISEILNHLDDYCDGIILLDDGSTDGTYKKAAHNKLLLKARKQYEGYFDDLKNRNALLRMANFFKSKWFIFIDADERFDSRYSNIANYINSPNIDILCFHLVDLWNNPNTYRCDMPDRNKKGIATRARMFRSKGSLQIYANREIHFPAIPYYKRVQIAQILLLHYGNYDQNIRNRKFKLYMSQDSDEKKQGHSYDFLKDKRVKLKQLNDIEITDLK